MAKKGRPRGSKNNQYLYASAVPAICPKCGSDKIKAIEGAPPIDQDYSGFLSDNRRFRGIRKQRSKCECGQYLMVKSYLAEKQKDNGQPIISAVN